MSGAAMSLAAASSGFVVFLLSVSDLNRCSSHLATLAVAALVTGCFVLIWWLNLSCFCVIQGKNDLRVTYTSTQICALKGSTVEIKCSYSYPPRENDRDTTVERTFWFTKLSGNEPVDVRTDSQYAGRVESDCENNICTLRITDLRERDSAEYKFSLITNQPGGSYTGSPGVTLSVKGLQVQVETSQKCKIEPCAKVNFRCHNSCHKPGQTFYIWYKNGQKISSYSGYSYSEDSYSCAVKGHDEFPSPSVCGHGDSCDRVTYTDRRICAFKGSSVNIFCTYSSYYTKSKFWFSPERSHHWRNPSQPQDLRADFQYAGRVHLFETERGHSTLRISDLRKSDSAEYHFKFRAGSWSSRSGSLPGTTLTVTDPDLQVQVIWSSTGPKLICHSSCLTDRSFFIWYKNDTRIQEETSPSYRGYVDPANRYSCAYESHRSSPVYAPLLPLVLVSPFGDIMRDSSASLTCSSDANPAAKYTWYKENQTLHNKDPQLIFNSIQPSDSGQYYCTVENELGRMTSKSVFVDVKYGPKASTVSVSPSGEIVEGSSVNLTCSSDANPAANYTWYKEKQTLLQGPEEIYHFTSIRSEDSGVYHCKAENQYSQISSTSLCIDVQYAPKRPSVSVSPYGEIVEGSSVNLTCSSDANPEANYTWYKENEDSPKASGQNFTITDFRAEHSGNYYCEAENKRGRHKSSVHLTAAAGALKSAVTGTITAVLLVITLLAVFIWIRRKKPFIQQLNRGERPDQRAQLNMGPLYDTPSAAAQRQSAEQQDDIHYASVSFSQNQTEVVYSNIRLAQPHRQIEEEDEDEEDGVDYSAVRVDGTRGQDDGEDAFALYSTVNKNYVNTT